LSKDPEQRTEGAHVEGSMLELQVLNVDDWPLWRELRLEALAEAPYAFRSALRDWQGAGDTETRWKERFSTVPLNIVARLNGKPAGIVGASIIDEGGAVELRSMWVAPYARGHGVGDALIQAVVSWVKEQRVNRVVLAVRNDNTRAIALYSRHGFIDSGPDPELADGQAPERLMILLLTT
jgi:ribosomal protein S18 acetylase RimI-like enzyme